MAEFTFWRTPVVVVAETFGPPRRDECEGRCAYYFAMPGMPSVSVMYVQVRRPMAVAA